MLVSEMSKGKDTYRFGHDWIPVLGRYCQQFSLLALALLSSVLAVGFTLRQVVYVFVCFSLLVKLPTSSCRLMFCPPKSLQMKEDVSFPRAQQKSQRRLLLVQPGSHAHHGPITVLGGVRVLIGQVADSINLTKWHRLSMEEG